MVSALLTLDFWISLVSSSLVLSIPMIVAAMGENFCEQSGVLSVSIEAYMLAGAMTAFAVASYTRNPWLGLLGGLLMGMALSLPHAFISVTVGGSQFVSGIGLVLFAFGFTAFWYRLAVGGGGIMTIPSLEILPIPFLSKIPVIGPILFRQDPFVYIALAMVPICAFISFRTTLGLKIRAVGHDPLAAESLGVSAYRMRYLGALLSGALGGLGGAYLIIGYLHIFMDGITGGMGFVVLAVLIAGNWSPYKILVMSVVFGFIQAMQLRLPSLGILRNEYQFMMMLPYIITILILILFRRISVPRAIAKPYKRAK